MEQHAFKIAQILQENGLVGINHGLMHGNIGLSIFFYHLAQETKNPKFERLADELLDKVFANLNTSGSADFENGFCGIGWGIEYLIQNGFAEGNADEILEELDNKVFKALHENNITSLELTNGLSGYLFYLISRLKKPSNSESMAKRINRELLILTINKLNELVTTLFPSIVKEMNFDLFWRFPVILFGLNEAFKLNIYNKKITCIITQWLSSFEIYIPSLHINRIYLAMVLAQINENIPSIRLKKQIQILLYATDFEILKTEVDPFTLNIRFGWMGFVWMLEKASHAIPPTYPNHQLISSTQKEIATKYKFTLENINTNDLQKNPALIGIGRGVAGIFLMELLCPGIFSSNNYKTETTTR